MRQMITRENVTALTELARVEYGWITQVRWSPTGDTLAIIGGEGVWLYLGSFGNAPTYELTGHTGHVKAGAFSPDGRWFASASADTTIHLWELDDLEAGPIILKGHTGSVETLAFSPSGHLLASGGADGTLRLWSQERLHNTIHGHEAEVESLAFALRGAVLVSGGRDKTVRLWDVANETAGTILGEHQDWVREVAVNESGTMIASAGRDMTIRLWDAYGDETYATIRAHYGGVDTIAFSPESKLLASGGRDHMVRLWSIEDALQTGTIQEDEALLALAEHEKPVLSMAFNSSGTLLATGSGDNTVRLWGVP